MDETCAICPPDPVTTATKDDDLPLCNGHWGLWLLSYLNTNTLPPCSAHLMNAEPLTENGEHDG